jgi:hypothetical protein
MSTTFPDEVRRRATGRRVELALLWDAFAAADPVDAQATDARARLARAIAAGQQAGAWSPSKRIAGPGDPPLPAFVTLPRADEPDRPDPARYGWVSQLQWAATLPRVNRRQLDMLRVVNAFLRDGGHRRPVVPAEERSLELFDDEKAISGQVGGKTLWGPGRLTHQLLRCSPSTTPFAYERVGDGDRLLVVENQATFVTCRDLLCETRDHPYAAVVFGAGAPAAGRMGYLEELPFPVAAVDYFGDLDVEGLEAAGACVQAARPYVDHAQLHPRLYQLLIGQTATPIRASSPPGPDRVRNATGLLPEPARAHAATLLAAGLRVAQERCGRELLSATSAWWDPTAKHPRDSGKQPANAQRPPR